MNILFVNHKMSQFGGIERYIYETASYLNSKNCQISFMAMDFFWDSKDLVTYKISVISKPRFFRNFIFAFVSAYKASVLKKEGAVDVIISNNSSSFRSDIVVAHSVHKVALIRLNELTRKEESFIKYVLISLFRFFRPQNIVTKFIEWYVYKFGSKIIIAVSEGVKRELIHFYHIPPSKIFVIPNGVDVVKFSRNEEARKTIRSFYHIVPDEIVCAFIAHEFKRKGLQFIIEALPYIRSQKVKILVVGNDSSSFYKQLAEKLGVGDNLIFVGQIKENIEDYYSASDLFVFPTGYEAFSLATLEASAAGLPLLITRVNGAEDLIQEGVNGFFIRRDAHDIAEKIDYIFDNNLYQELSNSSRKISEDFSWDKLTKETFKIVREIY